MTGVTCSKPDLSCLARQRTVPRSKSMSAHRSWRIAPMRCPVSCVSTSATWNRQSTRRETLRSARYSSSASTTRVGFFSVGVLRPLSGFLSRSRPPLVSRLRRPIQDRDQELQVVFDRPVGYGPSARSGAARAPRPDESVPVPLGQGGRVAVPSEEPEEHPHGGPVVPPRIRALGGRHLLTVGVKQLLQRERLGLGFGLACAPVAAAGPEVTGPIAARWRDRPRVCGVSGEPDVLASRKPLAGGHSRTPATTSPEVRNRGYSYPAGGRVRALQAILRPRVPPDRPPNAQNCGESGFRGSQGLVGGTAGVGRAWP